MQKIKILLIEDNPDDIMLAQRALKKCGFENNVVVTHNGIEALDYLFNTSKDTNEEKALLPMVVLLDLKMPKMDGIETLKQIRNNSKTAHIPVVILTSSDEEQDIALGYKYGANSYILKPVDFNKFLDIVSQLGLYWLTINKTLQKMGDA